MVVQCRNTRRGLAGVAAVLDGWLDETGERATLMFTSDGDQAGRRLAQGLIRTSEFDERLENFPCSTVLRLWRLRMDFQRLISNQLAGSHCRKKECYFFAC